jgi:hypothetical protein
LLAIGVARVEQATDASTATAASRGGAAWSTPLIPSTSQRGTIRPAASGRSTTNERGERASGVFLLFRWRNSQEQQLARSRIAALVATSVVT